MTDIIQSTAAFTTANMKAAYKEGGTEQLLGKIADNNGHNWDKLEIAHRVGNPITIGSNPTPAMSPADPATMGGTIYWYGSLSSIGADRNTMIVDQTLDWRDRIVSAQGHADPLSPNSIPGQSGDASITSHIENNAQAQVNYFAGCGYSEKGQAAASARPDGVTIPFLIQATDVVGESGNVFGGLWVGNDDGILYFTMNDDGNDNSINAIVHYSRKLGVGDET